MTKPSPPPGLRVDIQKQFSLEYRQRLSELYRSELKNRMKTCLIVMLILIITAVGVSLGGYYADAGRISKLAYLFTVLATVTIGCFGITWAGLAGIYFDMSSYAVAADREELNSVMQLEYILEYQQKNGGHE